MNDDNAFGPNLIGNQAERDDSCRYPDPGRSLQCRDHLEPFSNLLLEPGADSSEPLPNLSPASNHPGETLTLDEQTFEVKGEYERVFAPNA